VPSNGVSTWRTTSIGTFVPSGAVAQVRTDVYFSSSTFGVGVCLRSVRSPDSTSTS
jgi:hypothetical protein